jgi:hypothetical protein
MAELLLAVIRAGAGHFRGTLSMGGTQEFNAG